MTEKFDKEKTELEASYLKQIEELKVSSANTVKAYEEQIDGIKERYEKKLADL